MQITLHFRSMAELQKFVLEESKRLGYNESGEELKLAEVLSQGTIPDIKRRRSWTEFELNFLRTHYASKKLKWIAKQLRRKETSVGQMLHKMYKQGMARKIHRNSKVADHNN